MYPGRILAFTILIGVLSTQIASAQFLAFGRNKINYGRFDWHVLKTSHFDIYYYPEIQALTGIGAAYAENSFRDLERAFNFTIHSRIPLIFYGTPGDFQQTNTTPEFIPEGVGGFFEFLKGRVVIPNNGSMTQFRHVIKHELVHVFMHNKIEFILRTYRVPADRYPPLWFIEGLAELYSTEWDTQAEMLIRDAVINDYIVPVDRFWSINGTFLMYKEAQSALSFMKSEYGSESVMRLIDNIWLSNDFDNIIEYCIRDNIGEFNRKWIRFLKKQYYPSLLTTDDLFSKSKIVVKEGINYKPVYYRRGDSSYVIFSANANGYTSLYIASINGGEPRCLLQGERSDNLESFHAYYGRMSVSHSGLLAFAAKAGEKDVLHIFDIARERMLESVSFADIRMIGGVSWSPDAKNISLSGINDNGFSDLYVFDRTNRSTTKLTNDLYDDRDPDWSPDGAQIAFVSDRSRYGANGCYGIYLYTLADNRITTVVSDSVSYSSPVWWNDASHLLAVSNRNRIQQIESISLDPLGNQNALSRFTNFTTPVSDPIPVSGDGLVFSAFDTYRYQIHTISREQLSADSNILIKKSPADSMSTVWNPPSLRVASLSDTLGYKRIFGLDIVQSQISTDPIFGTLGGAAVGLSDMLGDDRYSIFLFNTAQTSGEILSNFNIAISHTFQIRQSPVAYGIYNYKGRRYDLSDPDVFYYERAFGGYLSAAYPFSRFDRIEGTTSMTNSSKEAIYSTNQHNVLLLSNSLSFVHDDALYYWTGPIDGNRYNITLAYTSDLRYSAINYYSVLFDYRRYIRLGLRSCIATRFHIYYNDGQEARRFFAGGSWDLRGWPLWSIRGTKSWLTSCELRFPLLDRIALAFPFGTMDFGILRGALFVDAGNSWDTKYMMTYGSIGAGLRLSLFGAFVLRYDFGKRIEQNFSLLQSGVFNQFFFGWDF
jgi:Tol biopolymer transport system component